MRGLEEKVRQVNRAGSHTKSFLNSNLLSAVFWIRDVLDQGDLERARNYCLAPRCREKTAGNRSGVGCRVGHARLSLCWVGFGGWVSSRIWWKSRDGGKVVLDHAWEKGASCRLQTLRLILGHFWAGLRVL